MSIFFRFLQFRNARSWLVPGQQQRARGADTNTCATVADPMETPCGRAHRRGCWFGWWSGESAGAMAASATILTIDFDNSWDVFDDLTPGHVCEKLPTTPGHVCAKLPETPGHVSEKLPETPGHVCQKLPETPGHVYKKLPVMLNCRVEPRIRGGTPTCQPCRPRYLCHACCADLCLPCRKTNGSKNGQGSPSGSTGQNAGRNFQGPKNGKMGGRKIFEAGASTKVVPDRKKLFPQVPKVASWGDFRGTACERLLPPKSLS